MIGKTILILHRYPFRVRYTNHVLNFIPSSPITIRPVPGKAQQWGIFATRYIPQDAKIKYLTGFFNTLAFEIESLYVRKLKSKGPVKFEWKDCVLDSVVYFLNHRCIKDVNSDKPNCEWKELRKDKTVSLYVKTKVPIQAGMELTVDYGSRSGFYSNPADPIYRPCWCCPPKLSRSTRE